MAVVSFALVSIDAYSALSALSVSPRLIQSTPVSCEYVSNAVSDIVSSWSLDKFVTPRYTLMIFTRLPGSALSDELLSNSTVPLSSSIRIALEAETDTALCSSEEADGEGEAFSPSALTGTRSRKKHRMDKAIFLYMALFYNKSGTMPSCAKNRRMQSSEASRSAENGGRHCNQNGGIPKGRKVFS